MGLNYNKNKHSEGSDAMWTSYSDLFLGLSIVFLLLYVTASLRQGTDGIRQHLEYQQLTKEAQDLRQQLKVYNALKQNYLEKEASQNEQAGYEELMSKLNLLQDEAKDEKIKLRNQAMDNEKKEQALNKYQQMIRNIINTNMISKSRIKNRDIMIDTKEEVITENKVEIKGLEKTVAQKKAQIAQGEAKIDGLEDQLDTRMKQLRSAYKNQQISKAKFEAQQASLKAETQRKIEALRDKNEEAEAQLAQMNNELAKTSSELQQTSTQLQSTKGRLAQTAAEKARLAQNLQATEARAQQEQAELKAQAQAEAAALKAQAEEQARNLKGSFAAQRAQDQASFERRANETKAAYEARMANERAGFEAQKAADRAAFEAKAHADRQAFDAQLNKEKLSGAQRAAKEAAFRAEADRKTREMEERLGAADKKTQALSRDLAKATENLNAKRKLAAGIKGKFAANGIKADVDPESGDVVLSFGDQYFDSGQANLKAGMKKILEQAMPLYSASLFENQKVADKIQSVEIVGFASPTFKGKFIDPNSLNQGDRDAVNYNLDLSYSRARSIFNHVFDRGKMDFKYQKQLLPLVKVTGRSFLAPEKDKNYVETGKGESFCRKNDCAKLQRVIIKFTLKD